MIVNKYDVDEKNTKFSFKNFKRALKYVKKYKKELIIIFILNLIITLGSLFWAKVIQYTLDVVVPAGVFKKILPISFMEITIIIFVLVFMKIKNEMLVKVNENIIIDLKNDLFSHIQYLSSYYFDTRPHGKILTRLTEYAESVSNLITNRLIDTILQVISLILTLIFMLLTSVKLTLVTLVGVVLLTLIFSITYKIKRKLRLVVNNKKANMNAYVFESLKGTDTTYAFNRQQRNSEINKNLTDDWCFSLCNILWYGNVTWCSINVMSTIINASIYAIGIFLLFPLTTIGTIVAMGSYSSRFWQPIRGLFSTMDEFIESITYLERILETIDEKIEIANNDKMIKRKIVGDIEFKDVVFSYNEDKVVLQNLSFKIKNGSKIAVVGETGSGKTTIANLLARFYDVNCGAVLIDDINVKDYDLKTLRTQVTIMQQDNYLFTDTVMNNLKYGNEHVKDNDVIKICKRVGVDDFIRKLPLGYETVLENHGSNISEGQRQLISYVRILINDPKILVLDEATSKIDVKTEEMIQKNIFKMLKDKTTITIAHRLSTTVNSDLILFIKDKKVYECGTHEELMKKKKEYYKLYTSQDNLI